MGLFLMFLDLFSCEEFKWSDVCIEKTEVAIKQEGSCV